MLHAINGLRHVTEHTCTLCDISALRPVTPPSYLTHLRRLKFLKLCGVTVRLKPDGTRWRTGGEVKGKLANEWVASTLHTTSELGVSIITTADAHTSAASSRLNWRPRRFKWTRSVSAKDEIWFLRVCHHISNAVYFKMAWICWLREFALSISYSLSTAIFL